MTRAQEGGSAVLTRHGCNLFICFRKQHTLCERGDKVWDKVWDNVRRPAACGLIVCLSDKGLSKVHLLECSHIVNASAKQE